MNNKDLQYYVKCFMHGMKMALDDLEAQEPKARLYGPEVATYDATPEANEVDNEPGLTPEQRRYARLERRDAVSKFKYVMLWNLNQGLQDNVGKFVKRLKERFAGNEEALIAVLANAYEFGFDKYEPKDPDPALWEKVVKGIPVVFKDPAMLAQFNLFFTQLGFRVEPVASAAQAAVAAESPVERVAREMGMPVPAAASEAKPGTPENPHVTAPPAPKPSRKRS